MRELSFEETKKIELEILTYFADFCEKNDLRYFLAYGTLIGAIRHKGFIPWDDDIDVHMPIEDYERLHEIFPKDGRYKLIYPTDKMARHTIIKIIDTKTLKIEKNVDYSDGAFGIDIDVFPLFNGPEDDNENEKWYKKLHRLYKNYVHSIIDKKTCKLKGKIYFTIVQPFLNRKKIVAKIEKLKNKYKDIETSYYVSYSCLPNKVFHRFKKELFSSSTTLLFENKNLMVAGEYDEVLRQTHGDYMQLPPIEKRITHHSKKNYLL